MQVARQELRKSMLVSLAAQATELARLALASRGVLLGANGGLRLLSAPSCAGPPSDTPAKFAGGRGAGSWPTNLPGTATSW